MRLCVALGGNALVQRGQSISPGVQRQNARVAAAALAPLFAEHEIILTHGNGPQVGLLLLENEADATLPGYPLDVLGAESEGMIGYLLAQALSHELPSLRVATILTQTIVARDDPAFAAPTKPVGPVYDEARARHLARERGFAIARDFNGYRRVVPSPEPLGLLEADAIVVLMQAGITPIAAGGGGVPVVLDDLGRPQGVEGVVDKDLTAVKLAELVAADMLVLLTDVDGVYTAFGEPGAHRLEQLTVSEARRLRQGADMAGSMGPKLEAAARFVESGGRSVIAALEAAAGAVAGRRGTRIVAG